MSTADWDAIAARDGITPEQARVLIDLWAWPIAFARHAAYTKALEGHPHWHVWRVEKMNEGPIPTLAAWQAFVDAKVAGPS